MRNTKMVSREGAQGLSNLAVENGAPEHTCYGSGGAVFMSASDEIDEMHLTPGGWVQGSSKIDFAGWTHVDPPADRLLTVSFREHMSSSFSPMDLSADETKHGSDAEILAALEEHGAEPRPGADRYRGWPEFLRTLGYNKKVG